MPANATTRHAVCRSTGATTLARKRIDDENCFGHEPSRASLTAIEGDAVIAAPDLTKKDTPVRMNCAVATNNMRYYVGPL